MINAIWQWLTAATNWSGEDGITHRLLQHLGYSLVVLLLAALIAIPLGVAVAHTGRGKTVVTLANSLRAVPTLGVLFALQMWWQPHLSGQNAFLVPCVVALVLLAIPPILSGAYAGVMSVDPAARDAAVGMGMRPRQLIAAVEWPCALPLLVSGMRSATLQVIATATIAAYVGLGGLGRFLVDGIATNDYPQTGGGALVVAALALLVEFLGIGISRWVAIGRTERHSNETHHCHPLRYRRSEHTCCLRWL